VQANEAIRMKLDRKVRVQEIRAKNDQQLAYSYGAVQESRSPVRKTTFVRESSPGRVTKVSERLSPTGKVLERRVERY